MHAPVDNQNKERKYKDQNRHHNRNNDVDNLIFWKLMFKMKVALESISLNEEY